MMSKLVAAYRGDNGSILATPATAPETSIASLSPRELDILRGIVRGASNKEIAREHGIAETTVKIHVQHVLRKLTLAPSPCRSDSGRANGLL